MAFKRFDIYQVDQEFTGEGTGELPYALIISPDEMNDTINTVIVAPLIPRGRSYPTRSEFRFQREDKQVVLDQLQTLNKIKLVRKAGRLSVSTQAKVLAVLNEMFAR